MGQILEQSMVATTLVGEWRIGATNLEQWVNGTRRDPLFTFALEQESPLVFAEKQTFTTKDGKDRSVTYTNRFVNGEFISRGRRLSGSMSRWSIGGIDPDRGILIVRMTHSRGGQDGLIVLVREVATRSELRATIATESDFFGIGPEDFASLSWLPTV